MKTIFTLLPPDTPINALDSVSTLAVNDNAHLFVVVMSIAIAVPGTVFPGVPSYGGEAEFAEMTRRAKERAEALETSLTELGVSHTVVTECQTVGGIASVICEKALFADLAVIPAQNTFTSSLYRKVLESILFDAGLPTIVLPDNFTGSVQLEKLLVAWHPSANAAKAVRDSISLFNQCSEVRIAIVDSTIEQYGPAPGDDMATFLARKELNVIVEQLSSNDKSVANTLKQAAIDFDSDLIVMGAYGHSRMRETIFGGTTKEMLENSPCPVLLSH